MGKLKRLKRTQRMLASKRAKAAVPAPSGDIKGRVAVEDWFARIQAASWERKYYAGVPFPLEGAQLVVEPSHPMAEVLRRVTAAQQVRVCRNEDVNDTTTIRNQWWSKRLRREVFIYEEDGKVDWVLSEPYDIDHHHRFNMMWETMEKFRVYDLDAELVALQRLRETTTEAQFKAWMISGAFIERSKRSGVIYIFRRQRPTLAVSQTTGTLVFLAALCLHPIGYYAGTWAGSMTPSDEAIAHLMLMRGDEHMFWRRSNQHPSWRREAGL